MVAIVTGEQLGLSFSSLSLLGQRGVTGNAAGGRNGELEYVNAATGNLVLQDRDDYLASVGAPVGMVRTYNSQGLLTEGGNDWSFGAARCRLAVNGTVDAAGSSIVAVMATSATTSRFPWLQSTVAGMPISRFLIVPPAKAVTNPST